MLQIAAIQMVSGTCLAENLTVAGELVAQAKASGAELVVLPENFALYGRASLRDEADAEAGGAGPIRHFLSHTSRTLKLWLAAGTIPSSRAVDGSPAMAGKVFARCSVFDAEGQEVGGYDKIHLFDVDVGDDVGRYRESHTLQAGSQLGLVESPWGKLGVAVCYDLRFPEYFRRLSEQGASILVVPSAFTYATGQAHWEVLLRAHAIENQCFVVAANQGGWHSDKRRTWGHSMIVSPWGTVMAEQAEGAGVVISAVDLEEIARLKKKMPVFEHRRFR